MTITIGSFANVNVGSSANDGTGDDLRTAFIKVNENFNNITAITSGSSGISWSISASGTSNYVFSGAGIESGNTDDPELYLYKGFTYTFVNTTGSNHPFAIRESAGGSNYTRGVSGSQSGTQTFTVPMDAPSTLYYQCTVHSGMGNVINII
jgi:plastocyanin